MKYYMNNIDIIFIGDSLTFGYGVHKESSWVYNLTRELSLSFLNKACNGDTSTGILSRYYNDVIKYNPKNIFLMCGTNDLLMGKKVEDIISNIEFMIKDALQINAQIILGIPPMIIGSMAAELFSPSSFYNYTEEQLPHLQSEILKLCSQFNLPYIDFYEMTWNKKELYLDGVHLNEKGHNLMFENFLEQFKNILY